MSEFLNTYIADNDFFGIVLSIVMFRIGMMVSKKTKIAFFNPLLLAIIFCIAFLKITGISYDNFNKGGKYISFMIAPITVALVVSLYRNIDRLKANLVPILIGVIVGSIVAILSAYFLSKIFKFDKNLTLSMMPQSVTTPIAKSLTEEYIGKFGADEVTIKTYAAITAITVILRGTVGAIFAPTVMKIMRVKDSVAIGIGIGTASHAMGTSKAIEMGEVEGAMSGLSIAIAGICTVILMPLFVMLFIS
ncbi:MULTISPECIES: LrgB family protein [Anaerococcus]|uniref:Inner membrane protein YohK n=1 Tax=Anaerococcus vaginalis TaxID=33037 RepID=A0A6N2TAF6_9FIRM|nr:MULTISPECIES: LrgB family protein [Anaerococcus]MDU5362834.1 LrgB family protein [Finegoldia magna]MBS4889581.1 LrgB family protein [Anaerococcus vaginalis]MBS6921389.1 LrgB family protein [Anaerococcus vaginalis]MDU1707658.1 LrgB family protein [Anaerococcus vaginalis]MDU1762610.1 LrgB family protein [Anaerococcus vaginalis]